MKPFISRADGSSKGDWDVYSLTFDAPKTDIIVLASGDGDFDVLIKKVISLNKNYTEVYGVSQLTANSLKNATSKFYAN